MFAEDYNFVYDPSLRTVAIYGAARFDFFDLEVSIQHADSTRIAVAQHHGASSGGKFREGDREPLLIIYSKDISSGALRHRIAHGVAGKAGSSGHWVIRRIEIDKIGRRDMAFDFSKVALKKSCLLQRIARSAKALFVKDPGLYIRTDRDVELTFRINPIQAIETRFVELNQTGSAFDISQFPGLLLPNVVIVLLSVRLLVLL